MEIIEKDFFLNVLSYLSDYGIGYKTDIAHVFSKYIKSGQTINDPMKLIWKESVNNSINILISNLKSKDYINYDANQELINLLIVDMPFFASITDKGLRYFKENRLLDKQLRLLDAQLKPVKPIKIKNTNNSIKPKAPINTLEDAVKNNDALNKIYVLLSEAELIDKDTKILKDKTGGYKGHFYSTIISFNEKGYFKRQPNKSEYLNICNNTFKADIKEGTARNHKTRQATTLNIPPFTLTD